MMKPLRRLIDVFRYWRPRRVDLRGVQQLAARTEERVDHVLGSIGVQREKLDEQIKRYQDEHQDLLQQLQTARRQLDRSEETLTELRAELRVADKVTIPALTAAHKLLLERWDAETMIQVKRGVVADINEDVQ